MSVVAVIWVAQAKLGPLSVDGLLSYFASKTVTFFRLLYSKGVQLTYLIQIIKIPMMKNNNIFMRFFIHTDSLVKLLCSNHLKNLDLF